MALFQKLVYVPAASAFQFAAWAVAAPLLPGGSGGAGGSGVPTGGLGSGGGQQLSPRADARLACAGLYTSDRCSDDGWSCFTLTLPAGAPALELWLLFQFHKVNAFSLALHPEFKQDVPVLPYFTFFWF